MTYVTWQAIKRLETDSKITLKSFDMKLSLVFPIFATAENKINVEEGTALKKYWPSVGWKWVILSTFESDCQDLTFFVGIITVFWKSWKSYRKTWSTWKWSRWLSEMDAVPIWGNLRIKSSPLRCRDFKFQIMQCYHLNSDEEYNSFEE